MNKKKTNSTLVKSNNKEDGELKKKTSPGHARKESKASNSSTNDGELLGKKKAPVGKKLYSNEKQKVSAVSDTTGNSPNDEEFGSDSSDEEVLIRTGNVPKEWYNEYDHAGYDANSNKVIKPPKEDEVEKFIKQAKDKNWWRNIFDDENNKEVFISKKDIELIKRIRSGLFANEKLGGEEYEYFETNLEKEIHPASNHRLPKKHFEVSKNERKMINRIISAYNNGFIKLFDDENEGTKKKQEEELYDMWFNETTDPNKYNPSKGFPAPKRPLPDVEESYNPPDEVVTSLTEKKRDLEKNDIYGLGAAEEIFEPKKYDSLRKIPFFKDLFPENFYRMCDLFMSSRFIRKKKDIKEEDLVPQLPKPEELRPYPTTESVNFKGHESSVKALCVDPSGKFLISGDSAGFIMFFDIDTTKIVKRINVNDDILHINFNPILNLVTIVCKEHVYFMLPPYLDRKTLADVQNLIQTKIQPLMEQTINEYSSATEPLKFKWEIPKDNSNGIVFYQKWLEGTLKSVSWHNKGDYFATLSKNTLGKTQVLIHSLSKLSFQTPFSKIKGTINDTSFHPQKPYFVVATNSNIFLYNLQKQEMIRKFVSNLNTITHISLHKDGDNILAGTKDGKVAWFQLDLSDKPYKIMEFHDDKIKSVAYHEKYPIMSSSSRNGKILVYHATIYDDLIQDPLIVPLKVLKLTDNSLISSTTFHPKHPWVFSGSDNGSIKLWI